MAETQTDFTMGFRALSDQPVGTALAAADGFAEWSRDWTARLARDPGDADRVMAGANPAVIPRNHRIEEAIEAAIGGETGPFHELGRRLARPFEAMADDPYSAAPSPEERVTRTFCGT